MIPPQAPFCNIKIYFYILNIYNNNYSLLYIYKLIFINNDLN